MSNEVAPRTLVGPTADLPADAAFRTLALAIGAFGLVRIAWMVPAAPYQLDFSHYYLSARIALAGDNPYTTPLKPLCEELGLEYHPHIPFGANPPLLIRLFMLIAWLPPNWAYVLWLATEIGGLFVLLDLTRRLLSTSWDDWRHLAWVALVLNSNAVMHHFRYSQVQLLIAAALAAATWLAVRGRRYSAVGLIAAAAAFKLYPAVLLPWFMLTRLTGWRDLLKRAFVVAGVSAVALAIAGPAMWTSFLKDGVPVIQISVGRYVSNYSLQSVAVMLDNTMHDIVLGPPSGTRILWIGKGLAIASLGAAYWVAWRRRLDDVAAVGLISVAMIAASVVCWSHYFVLLIPAATLVVSNATAAATRTGKIAGPLIASILMMPKTGGVIPSGEGPLGRLWLHVYLSLHLYPVAALAAFAVCLALTSRRPKMTTD